MVTSCWPPSPASRPEAGAEATFDTVTANTLTLRGPVFGLDPGNALTVTGGDVLFKSFPKTEGLPFNTVTIDGPTLIVDGNAQLIGETTINNAEIGKVKFFYQGPGYGPVPDANGTPVQLWGNLVCDNDHIGAMAVGWFGKGTFKPVPLDGLKPGNGAGLTDFTKGFYVTMFCAPGGDDDTPQAGWVPFPSPF